jgi:hypothetical protein
MNPLTNHEDSAQEFLALYKAASPVHQFAVQVLINAGAANDTASLHELIRLCPCDHQVKEAAQLMIAAIEKSLAKEVKA